MLSKLIICVLLISSVVLVLAGDAENKGADEPFDKTIKLLCSNIDMDDSVVGNIISNCKSGLFSDTQDWAVSCIRIVFESINNQSVLFQKIEDDIMMGCIKKTSLTDRERLTAFCDETVGKCCDEGLRKKLKEISAGKKPTADQIKKSMDAMQKTFVR